MSARCAILVAVGLVAMAGPATGAPGVRRVSVTILSLESNLPPVEGMVNLQDVTLGKRVSWTKEFDSTADDSAARFAGSGPRTLEMIVTLTDKDVRVVVARLEDMAKEDEQMKRPPRLKVVWSYGLPAFEGVIESIGTKYTMFLPDGTAARATTNVRMREAGRAGGPRQCKQDLECPDGQACISLTCQER